MIRTQCFQITFALAIHSSMILPRNLKEYMYVYMIKVLTRMRTHKAEMVYFMSLQCKHQVAVFLSNALEKTRIQTVQDLVIAEILQDITR